MGDISLDQSRILQLEAELNRLKANLAGKNLAPKLDHPSAESNLTHEDYIQLLFDVAFEGLVIHSNFTILNVNAAVCKIWGYEIAEVIGTNIIDFIVPEDRDLVKTNIANSHTKSYEVTGIRRDGSRFPVEVQGKSLHWRGQNIRVTATRDISDRKTIEAAIAEGEKRYKTLFANKSEAVFIHSFSSDGKPGNFIEVNDAACASLEYTNAELLQMSPRDITPKDYQPPFDIPQKLAQSRYALFEARHLTKSGKIFPVEIRTVLLEGNSLLDGNSKNLVINFALNISDRKATETELARVASLDYLTQVANRRQFDQYLEAEWLKSWRSKTCLSLVMADIDFFKPYNDYYGHHAGDQCLQKVATAIAGSIKRSTDLVARYGGEEFGIILPATNSMGAIYTAKSIIQAVEDTKIEHAKSAISPFVTISLGLATFIPASADFAILIKAADQALYHAKRLGRNRLYVIQNSEEMDKYSCSF